MGQDCSTKFRLLLVPGAGRVLDDDAAILAGLVLPVAVVLIHIERDEALARKLNRESQLGPGLADDLRLRGRLFWETGGDSDAAE